MFFNITEPMKLIAKKVFLALVATMGIFIGLIVFSRVGIMHHRANQPIRQGISELMWTFRNKSEIVSTAKNDSEHPDSSRCPDILAGMVKGRWVTRPLTDFEQMSIDAYLQAERSAFNIPPTLQRSDGKCGDNITYEETPQYHHMWFKSICDPKGATPCCKDARCVDLPVEDCRCPTCYDERQVIYPEFSAWQPDDTRCKPKTFTKEEACSLLKGATIHVIGDSFVRQVYIALAILLTGDHVDGALKSDMDNVDRNKCLGMFQVTGAACRYAIFEKGRLCGGTVKISYTEIWNAKDVWQVKTKLVELQHTPKSFLLLGLGIHDDFNAASLHKHFLQPIFKTSRTPKKTGCCSSPHSNTSRETSGQKLLNSSISQPTLFWMGIHSPGLLKSSHWSAQSAQGVKDFNYVVGKILDQEKIPRLETFDFTKGVLSFDGTHYGLAINMLKVNMFLTYIRETSGQGKVRR